MMGELVMQLLLIGATGLVGQHVLMQALDNPAITRIIAPVRRALPERLSNRLASTITHEKLLVPVIDFEHLDEHAAYWQNIDAVICALGSTRKKAGSKAAFRHIDYDYSLNIAHLVEQYGTQCFALNSSMGADADSSLFYLQVKGELERDLGRLNFMSLTLVRPGFIGGKREEFRPSEIVAKALFKLFAPLLPQKYRLNPPENIAYQLLNAAIERQPGLHIVSAEEMI